MGIIYLKVDPAKITAENINKYEINSTSINEAIETLSKHPHLKELLISRNCSSHVQRALDDTGLTMEQCMSLIKNCNDPIDRFTTKYINYPSDFLLEYGAKMDLYYIENQENITHEFVQKYHHRMDLARFLYIKGNDAYSYITNLSIFRSYVKNIVDWKTQSSKIFNVLENCPLEIPVKIKESIHEWYNSPVTIERLTADLEMSSELNFYLNAYTKGQQNKSFSNWDEFVEDCDNKCMADLPYFWFDFAFIQKLTNLINYHM